MDNGRKWWSVCSIALGRISAEFNAPTTSTEKDTDELSCIICGLAHT